MFKITNEIIFIVFLVLFLIFILIKIFALPEMPVEFDSGSNTIKTDNNNCIAVSLIKYQPITWNCTGSKYQKWNIKDNMISNGDLCLGYKDRKTNISKCTNKASQKWHLSDNGKIINNKTGLCISKNKHGKIPILSDCNNNNSFRFFD